MITTSKTYKELLADEHSFESQVIIDGITYGEDSIVSMSTSHKLLGGSGPSVGNCCAAEIEVTILTPETSPGRMAKIQPQVRITDGTTYSEWINQGIFFIDVRSKNKKNGTTTFHGYDAVMIMGQLAIKAEYGPDKPAGDWTYTDLQYIDNFVVPVLKPYGITVDTTGINKGYHCYYPGYGTDGAMTMRQVMAYIAAYYGANWYIDYNGVMKLLLLGNVPEEEYCLCNEYGVSIESTDGYYIDVDGVPTLQSESCEIEVY